MAAIIASAALVVALSVLVGRAITSLCGEREWSWTSPVVGLSALILIGGAAIKLPGGAATAAWVLAIVGLAAFVYVWRRVGLRWPGTAVAVAFLPSLAAMIPFIASGYGGALGPGVDNDMVEHLVWTEGLRSPVVGHFFPAPVGYPIGPHSLVASLGTLTGASVEWVFTGLAVAVIPLTALAAAGAIPAEAWWRKALAGLMVAIAYLAAAYYSQGSFKETIFAAQLLAFAVIAMELRRRARRGLLPATAMIPAGLLIAGAIDTYSYVAIAWFALLIALWAALETVAAGPLTVLQHGRALARRGRAIVGQAVAAPALAGAVTLIALAPSAGRILDFYTATNVTPGGSAIPQTAPGNVPSPLSPLEAFGVYLSPDYRNSPPNVLHTGMFGALAVGLLLFGVLWSLARREFPLPAGVGACALVYLISKHGESYYVVAKALAVAAPLVMATTTRSLLVRREPGPAAASGGASLGQLDYLRLAVLVPFAVLALRSSYLALRAAPVLAPDPGRELRSMRALVGHSSVLYLGVDDFVIWYMAGAQLTAADPSTVRPEKPYVYGDPYDFDSVPAASLDQVTYVITTSARYASEVPANFRLVRAMTLYDLWRRVGPTEPRDTIEGGADPVATLDCSTRAGRRLAGEPGVASVMDGLASFPTPSLPPGHSEQFAVPLPRGRWDLTLAYNSEVPVHVSVGATAWVMPPLVARPGPRYYVGTLTSTGPHVPVLIRIAASRPSRISVDGAALGGAWLTPSPPSRRLLPLARSCGQLVDWYRPTAAPRRRLSSSSGASGLR